MLFTIKIIQFNSEINKLFKGDLKINNIKINIKFIIKKKKLQKFNIICT